MRGYLQEAGLMAAMSGTYAPKARLMCSTAEALTATVPSPVTCLLSAGLLRRLLLEA